MQFNGSLLLKARQAKGVTQEQLGVAAGLTGMTVHRLEVGKANNPTLDTIRSLANELGIAPEDLLTNSATAKKVSA